MNLPNIISELVKAQENFDSHRYAECFTDTAVVYDEGKIHHGRIEIENWIRLANNEYQTVMKPQNFSQDENILEAEISGTFPGSPLVLQYHFDLRDGLIQTLKITD
ncbi:nuclear transport factor 2 family protein [Chryseobacterium sp. CP-77]|uniref:nuclear transport factor 2 family protein n=1 Tax=Chryseobacterium sp. CP-77 TaxID=3116594 RepID=UPI002ED09DD9